MSQILGAPHLPPSAAYLVKGGQPFDPGTEVTGCQQQVDAFFQLHILFFILTNVHLQCVTSHNTPSILLQQREYLNYTKVDQGCTQCCSRVAHEKIPCKWSTCTAYLNFLSFRIQLRLLEAHFRRLSRCFCKKRHHERNLQSQLQNFIVVLELKFPMTSLLNSRGVL